MDNHLGYFSKDAKSEEEEALAEIKKALDFTQPQPPKTISIPSIPVYSLRPRRSKHATRVHSPTSADQTNTTVDTGSSFGDHHDVTKLGNTSLEEEQLQPIIGLPFSRGADSNYEESPKFYLGSSSQEEEVASIPSRVSLLEMDEMSHNEVVTLVERLYTNLKTADLALTREQERRTAREKSLIKLAMELRRRKEIVTDLTEQVHEVSPSRSCRSLHIFDH